MISLLIIITKTNLALSLTKRKAVLTYIKRIAQ